MIFHIYGLGCTTVDNRVGVGIGDPLLVGHSIPILGSVLVIWSGDGGRDSPLENGPRRDFFLLLHGNPRFYRLKNKKELKQYSF